MNMTEQEAYEKVRDRLYSSYGGKEKYLEYIKEHGIGAPRVSGLAAIELTQKHLDSRPSMRPKRRR